MSEPAKVPGNPEGIPITDPRRTLLEHRMHNDPRFHRAVNVMVMMIGECGFSLSDAVDAAICAEIILCAQRQRELMERTVKP